MSMGDPHPDTRTMGVYGIYVPLPAFQECGCSMPLIKHGRFGAVCELCGLPERTPTHAELIRDNPELVRVFESGGFKVRPMWSPPVVEEVEHSAVQAMRDCALAFEELARDYVQDAKDIAEDPAGNRALLRASASSLQYAAGFIRDRLVLDGYPAFAP